MLFQTTFEPKLVADASKELVLVLSQRKIRCVAIFFSGSAEVAAGLSNKKVEEESRAIRL